MRITIKVEINGFVRCLLRALFGVTVEDGVLVVEDQHFRVKALRQPGDLPWLDVHIALGVHMTL